MTQLYIWDINKVTQKSVLSYALLNSGFYFFFLTSLVIYADVTTGNTTSLLQQAVDKLSNKNETEKAIEILQHMVEKDPSSGEAYHYLGLANVSKRQWKKAEEYLKLATVYLPDETTVKYQLGKIYLNEMAQTEKAIPLLLYVVQQNPNYEDVRLLLGKAYLQTNNVKEVIDLLQPLTEKKVLFRKTAIDQDMVQLHLLLGRAYFQQREIEDAIQHLKIVVDTNPFDALAYFHLANCYLQIGRVTEGKKMLSMFEQRRQENADLEPLKRMVREVPDDFDAWFHLGTLELKRQNWDVAENAFKICIDLSIEIPEVYESLGKLYVQKKAYFKAVKIYKLLLEDNPQNTTYWNNLGYAHVKMEDFEQAHQDFQKAVQIEPDNPSFHLNLSKTYHVLGYTKKAESEYRIYQQLSSQQ
ncbi:TPA: hypothetical protein DHW51_14785 [Candidatus Poribacteria bacterium]|mgnify:FL=1|nr:hypothetical protein [Candidatus Poribacteria bacterium]